MAVILVGFGITNLSLAIIAEYLVRDLDASRGRPTFIVDTITTDMREGRDDNEPKR